MRTTVLSCLVVAGMLACGVCWAADGGVTGPMLGAVDEHTAHVWLRPDGEATVTLTVRDSQGMPVFEERKTAKPENDSCLHWRADGLTPATGYSYGFTWQSGGGATAPSGPWPLTTAPRADLPGRVCLAFGSCASEKFPAIWERMAVEGAEAVFLCGDTPTLTSTWIQMDGTRLHEHVIQVEPAAE